MSIPTCKRKCSQLRMLWDRKGRFVAHNFYLFARPSFCKVDKNHVERFVKVRSCNFKLYVSSLVCIVFLSLFFSFSFLVDLCFSRYSLFFPHLFSLSLPSLLDCLSLFSLLCVLLRSHFTYPASPHFTFPHVTSTHFFMHSCIARSLFQSYKIMFCTSPHQI